MLKYVLLILLAVLSAFVYQTVQPLRVGISTTLNEIKIPYSWDVRPQNVPLAIITPPEPEWLRIMSFSEYVNGTWLRGKPSHIPERTGGTVFKITVTPIGALTFNYLPYPQPAPGYRPSGPFNGDTLPISSSTTEVIVNYRAPYPYGEAPELDVPLNLLPLHPQNISTERVRLLAKKLAANATTLKDLVDNIQGFLRRNYKYALTYAGTPGKDPVDWFLFVSKTGMCVHFASAAAVLLKIIGIETRLVVGLAVSEKVDQIRVFVLPMHAWVEIYVPNRGWVAWDPSPRIRLNQENVPIGGSAPIATGGGPVVNPPQAPRPTFRLNLRWLSYLLMLSVFIVLVYYNKPRLKPWPLLLRDCVEKCYNIRGLTLEEVAQIVGGDLGYKVKEYYLRVMKGERTYTINVIALLKTLIWCIRCSLGSQSHS